MSIRRAMRAICLGAAVVTGCHAALSANALSLQDLRERALGGKQARQIVASLVTEVGPRATGSAGDRAAVAWAVRTLKELGFQNVRTQEVLAPHWQRGAIEIAISSPKTQSLVGAALGGSVATPANGIEAPIVQTTGIEELEALGREKVSGKIVFFNTRMLATRDGSGYGIARKVRSDGATVAGRLGAVAVLIRSLGTGSEHLVHTGKVNYESTALRIPAAALANADADRLARELASGSSVTARIKLEAHDLPPARTANVIGEIPGDGPEPGIVLLGAHLDSWDLGPGALDDAAGVAIVIEAARLIATQKPGPRRTLRVVLFADEEFGLSGARAYADQAAGELPRHVVAMEADFGAGPVWRFDTRVPESALAQVQIVAESLRALGVEPGNNVTGGGSDLQPLREAGVPVFHLLQDGSHYFDSHHSAADTLDKVDARALNQSVAAYAIAAYHAATMTAELGRLPVKDQ